MRHLGEDELMHMMGIGYPGELRAGPDGNLYEWVQGVDGLGNPYGFWRIFKRIARGVRRFARKRLRPLLRRYLPAVSQAAAFIPGVGPLVSSGIRTATPYLQRAGLVGVDGIGALYQAPDGSLYQVSGYGGMGEDEELSGYGGIAEDEELQGFAEDEELQGFAEDEELSGLAQDELAQDELTQTMGMGYPGELRAGPDGNLYEWVQGVDGLGNPYGFWRIFKRIARGVRRFARKRLRPLLRRYLPAVSQAAAFIPGVGPLVSSGIRTATPYLQRAGLVGVDGIGALYQAPDGSLYQVSGYGGMGEDEELSGYGGIAEDEELQGFAEDEELSGYSRYSGYDGFAEDEELQGFAEDEEMGYFAEDEELNGYHGISEDEELQGFAEDEELGDLYGYVKENQMKGLEAFVKDTPAGTRMFTTPAQPPDLWKPLW